MIEEAANKEKEMSDFETILNARLCAVIFNSQGGLNGKAVEIDAFLPDGMKSKHNLPLSKEDQIKRILDRGNMLAHKCEM